MFTRFVAIALATLLTPMLVSASPLDQADSTTSFSIEDPILAAEVLESVLGPINPSLQQQITEHSCWVIYVIFWFVDSGSTYVSYGCDDGAVGGPFPAEDSTTVYRGPILLPEG